MQETLIDEPLLHETLHGGDPVGIARDAGGRRGWSYFLRSTAFSSWALLIDERPSTFIRLASS